MTTSATPDDPAPGRVLISGSAAPFAQRLVDQLKARGWGVDMIVHTDPTHVISTHAIHHSSAAPDSLSTAAQTADAVILLSGIDSINSMVDDSHDLDEVLGNLKPGATLVEVTTMAVFGDAPDGRVVSEHERPTVPGDLDPVAACEIRVLASGNWLRGVVVRPGLVYGDAGGVALTPMIDFARDRGTSRYFGEGSDVLPTVHEDDLIELLVRVVTDASARGIYHAASGEVSTRDLANLVAVAAGVATVEPWSNDALQNEFGTTQQPPRVSVRADPDGGRATRELGWRPEAPPLDQALGNT